MNREIRQMQNNLHLLYYRYKDSPYFSLAVITLVICGCIILFFQVIIPQINDWFSVREEVLRTRERIVSINKNIDFMNVIDKPLLNDQVEIAINTLPIEKNFGAIVNSLSYSAVKSGIVLDDFSFEVGNIASSEGQLKLFGQKGLSIVKLTLSLSGNIDSIAIFLREIQERIPLSEVTEVDGDTFSTIITLQYFQKQFPVIVYKDDVPLSPISSSRLALIKKLSTWMPNIPKEEEVGTESAGSVPLF